MVEVIRTKCKNIFVSGVIYHGISHVITFVDWNMQRVKTLN